jgi:hypothetical protein
MKRAMHREAQLRSLGGWVGAASTLTITALLPSYVWVRGCMEVPSGWPRFSQSLLVVCLLAVLAWIGHRVGQVFAPALIQGSWWSFPFIGCAAGGILTFASALALALGSLTVDLFHGHTLGHVLGEYLVAWLAFTYFGLFIGLPWGWLTSLVIRIAGRFQEREV